MLQTKKCRDQVVGFGPGAFSSTFFFFFFLSFFSFFAIGSSSAPGFQCLNAWIKYSEAGGNNVHQRLEKMWESAVGIFLSHSHSPACVSKSSFQVGGEKKWRGSGQVFKRKWGIGHFAKKGNVARGKCARNTVLLPPICMKHTTQYLGKWGVGKKCLWGADKAASCLVGASGALVV